MVHHRAYIPPIVTVAHYGIHPHAISYFFMHPRKYGIITTERMVVILPVQVRAAKPAVGKMVGRFQSGTRDSLISRKNKAVLIPGHDRPVAQFPDVVQPVFQLRMIPVVRGNAVPYFPHPLFILYFRNKHAERTVPQVQALALVLAGPPRLKSQINTLIRRTGQGKGVGACRLQVVGLFLADRRRPGSGTRQHAGAGRQRQQNYGIHLHIGHGWKFF